MGTGSVAFVWGWEWDPPFVAAIVVAELVYVVLWARGGIGSRRLRLTPSRMAAFTAAMAVMAIALLSPIAVNGERLLSMHMVEHDLLIWVVAPLVLVGVAPMLDRAERLPAIVRNAGGHLTRPLVAWVTSTILLWVWHAPLAYAWTLADETVHHIEHLSFLGAYLLYWWPLIESSREMDSLATNGARVAYLVAGMMQSALLGALITFHQSVLYTAYLHVPGATPASALADQRLAGALMWFPGAIVFTVAAALVIRQPARLSTRVV
ncbi:MAG TPA: cytochrome c oxidase assembly protein [Gemmatimonadaceae bacterium]|nr:cytochrome c oxidase assembly protein [Gemmatimonadaceae bacterium]